jgi:hypothetical protein
MFRTPEGDDPVLDKYGKKVLERISGDTLAGLYHELIDSGRKCCQGCRARITLERNPKLVGLFLDFWYRTGAFPRSTSWLEAAPPSQFNLWTREIRAAFQKEETRGLQVFNSRKEDQKSEGKNRGAEGPGERCMSRQECRGSSSLSRFL